MTRNRALQKSAQSPTRRTRIWTSIDVTDSVSDLPVASKSGPSNRRASRSGAPPTVSAAGLIALNLRTACGKAVGRMASGPRGTAMPNRCRHRSSSKSELCEVESFQVVWGPGVCSSGPHMSTLHRRSPELDTCTHATHTLCQPTPAGQSRCPSTTASSLHATPNASGPSTRCHARALMGGHHEMHTETNPPRRTIADNRHACMCAHTHMHPHTRNTDTHACFRRHLPLTSPRAACKLCAMLQVCNSPNILSKHTPRECAGGGDKLRTEETRFAAAPDRPEILQNLSMKTRRHGVARGGCCSNIAEFRPNVASLVQVGAGWSVCDPNRPSAKKTPNMFRGVCSSPVGVCSHRLHKGQRGGEQHLCTS